MNEIKTLTEALHVYSDFIKEVAAFLPIVWALFIFSEWRLLRNYYRQFMVEQWFKPTYRIAVDPRYIVSFILTFFVWSVSCALALASFYSWWTLLSSLVVLLFLLFVYWGGGQLRSILGDILFCFYGGMLSSKELGEGKHVNTDLPLVFLEIPGYSTYGEYIFRKHFRGFLKKYNKIKSMDKLGDIELEWMNNDCKQTIGTLDYGSYFTLAYSDHDSTNKKMFKMSTAIKSFLLVWSLRLVLVCILKADTMAWLILSFILLCPIWHNYIFLSNTRGFKEVLEGHSMYCPCFQKLRIIEDDGKRYVIVSPNSYDSNQHCVLVRAEVFERMGVMNCAVLCSNDCKVVSSPYCGKSYSVNVHFIKFERYNTRYSDYNELVMMPSLNTWIDIWWSDVFLHGKWEKCLKIFEKSEPNGHWRGSYYADKVLIQSFSQKRMEKK